jgi:hypothetical protein
MIEALISFLNAQAAQLNFFVGSHVWVEDPDVAWIDGEILESNDQEITISNESGTKVSLLKSICISLILACYTRFCVYNIILSRF